jgi:hypothetical protein
MRILTFGVFVVALSSPPLSIQAAQSAATITGRVIDGDTQAPLAGARVMLLPALMGAPRGPMGPPVQTVTGDDGRYTFSGIAEGSYRLQVQRIGFIQPTDSPTVQVGAGQTLAGPDLRLSKGGAISGRILDARGEPMAEVMVTALRKRSDNGGPGPSRGGPPALPAGQPGQTNDIGEFRIAGLPSGDYYVSASSRPTTLGGSSSPSGGATPVTTFYPGTATMAEAHVLAVAAGQTISSLEFGMLFAPGYSVVGVVVDETNAPVAGAMVILMLNQVVGPGPRGSARTEPDGTFRINGVAPGAYRLNASIPVAFSNSSGGIGSVSYSSGPSSMIQVTVVDRDVAGLTVVARKPTTR